MRQRRLWLILLLAAPGLLAICGWFAAPAVGRLHPTIELWRQVEADMGDPQDTRPDAVEAFYATAGNTAELLEAEAAAVYGRIRAGMMIAGAFVGLAVAAQGAVQMRRPLRYSFQVNQRTCLACARCMDYCPQGRGRPTGNGAGVEKQAVASGEQA